MVCVNELHASFVVNFISVVSRFSLSQLFLIGILLYQGSWGVAGFTRFNLYWKKVYQTMCFDAFLL